MKVSFWESPEGMQWLHCLCMILFSVAYFLCHLHLAELHNSKKYFRKKVLQILGISSVAHQFQCLTSWCSMIHVDCEQSLYFLHEKSLGYHVPFEELLSSWIFWATEVWGERHILSIAFGLPDVISWKHWFRNTSEVAVKQSWLSCLKIGSPAKINIYKCISDASHWIITGCFGIQL